MYIIFLFKFIQQGVVGNFHFIVFNVLHIHSHAHTPRHLKTRWLTQALALCAQIQWLVGWIGWDGTRRVQLVGIE